MNLRLSVKWTPAIVAIAALGLCGCAKSTALQAVAANSRPASTAATTTTAPSSSSPATAPASGYPMAVQLVDFKVNLPQTTLPAGKYNLTIKNNGSMQHELLVFKSDLAPSAYPLDAAGNIKEDGPGITKISDGDNIGSGDTQTRTVDLSTPGKYMFVCNLPGHFRAGMYQVVTVTPAGETPALTASSPTVALRDFKVDLAQTTFSPGLYTLSIKDDGKVQHELLVFRSDLAPSAYPLDASGDINEDGPGITKISDGDNLDPGGTQTRTVDLSAPGTYLFLCNLPGHFKAGMYQVVTVK